MATPVGIGGELQSMLESCMQQATAALAETSRVQLASCQTQIVRMFQAQQEAVAKTLSIQTRDVAKIGERADALEAEQAHMREQMTLAMAEKEIPIVDFQELEAWTRKPNPRVFSVGAPELVGPAQVLQGLGEWLRVAAVS